MQIAPHDRGRLSFILISLAADLLTAVTNKFKVCRCGRRSSAESPRGCGRRKAQKKTRREFHVVWRPRAGQCEQPGAAAEAPGPGNQVPKKKNSPEFEKVHQRRRCHSTPTRGLRRRRGGKLDKRLRILRQKKSRIQEQIVVSVNEEFPANTSMTFCGASVTFLFSLNTLKSKK
ncbi:hypothetical protein L596_007322 [Steinernema carpocapsae]|uniref:Uncharacterized protein n=1 Tax=Steinernema carpocapsae TaxID=34508 RepID=A0A4V6A5Y4_STECR|nr:hypothetical protein L596_007322 [Steinernema carpocapsae]